METQDMELQAPNPKPRGRKIPVFGGRASREEDIIIPENTSTSSMEMSRSRQTSEEASTITNMPNMGGMGMGGSMLDGPMRPKLVQQPVRRKSSIFRRIRDKLRRGSLISSSTGDSAQSSATASTASAGPNPGIAGLLGMQGNLLSPDLADMLFKTAAAATAAPMSVTGDHSCQEYCSSPYQQQQSMSRQTSTNSYSKPRNQEADASGGALIASTELASELKMAFSNYAKSCKAIPAREVGYILRSLGQNPTEDEINNMICEAGCDYEGYLDADDFLSVALVSMQKQADRMDDVRAAFRAFDHNGDGTISKEELKEAMQRFGHSFTEDECDEMFMQADLNADGIIDWDEFVHMMSPEEHEVDMHNDPGSKYRV